MASTLKHLRSSTANKRPTASGIADGQIAINTASGTPALFFKDNADNIVKVGPVHVGATAPNASPAGSAGNSTGELWVDNSLTTQGLKYYSGTAFINLTPSGTTSAAGLVELATNAETQTGSDAVRAVTPAGLQSKVSDSTSTTSSTTIASATAVKSAYDLADAALPKSGGTVTGEILINPSGSLVFEGSSDDSFETTLAVVNPTADRTITLPNITGTVVTTGDTGTVTSTMIADGTIVNADINASAAIAPSKLGSGALPNDVTVSSTNIVDGTIVNADVNASAAIAGTKISPNFGGQNVVTTGSVTGASLIPSSSTVPTNGLYLPAANTVAVSTNSTGRLFVDANGNVGVNTASPLGFLHIETPATTAGWQLRLDSVGLANESGFFRDASDNYECVLRNGAGGLSFIKNSGGNTTPNLVFYVDPFERLCIDSSGRLLVGTSSARGGWYNTTGTSASPLLQLDGTSFNTSSIALSTNQNSATEGPRLLLGKSRGTAPNSFTVVQNNDDLGSIDFFGADGTNFVNGARIRAFVDGAPGADDLPTRLVFETTPNGGTSPSRRMTIQSGGAVLIGSTTFVDPAVGSNDGFTVNSDGFTGISTSNLAPLHLRRRTTDGNIIIFRRDTTQVGSISVTTTATAYNTSSDYRLKENIVPVTNGITRLQQLKPSRFNFIADPDKTVDGFLAHEVQTIVPEAITGEKDAVDDEGNPQYQGIDQSKIVPLVVAALQEAIAKIETLEQRLNDAGIN